MAEPGEPQRGRIKHRQDDADDELAAHEAGNRVVNVAGQTPDILALQLREPHIERGDRAVPVDQQIDRDDRRDDQKRQEPDQHLAARPQRAQQFVEPGAASRCHEIDRRLLDPEVMAGDAPQPACVRIGQQRLDAGDIGREGRDEEAELGNKERHYHQDDGDECHEKQRHQHDGRKRAVETGTLQAVENRYEQICREHPLSTKGIRIWCRSTSMTIATTAIPTQKTVGRVTLIGSLDDACGRSCIGKCRTNFGAVETPSN